MGDGRNDEWAAPMETPVAGIRRRQVACGDEGAWGLCGAATSDMRALAMLIEESEQCHEVGDYLAAAAEAGRAMDASHPASRAAAARRDCVDFLLKLCRCFQVSSVTVCWCIKVLDIFLSRACSIAPCQPLFHGVAAMCSNAALLSASCFLVTCKFREVMCPLLQDLEHLIGGHCTVADLRQGEEVLLAAIDWNIHNVTAVDICIKIMSSAPPIVRAHLLYEAQLIAEVATCSEGMLGHSAASIAVCSISLAAENLNVPPECTSFIPGWVLARVDVAGGVADMRSLVVSLAQQEHDPEYASAAPTPHPHPPHLSEQGHDSPGRGDVESPASSELPAASFGCCVSLSVIPPPADSETCQRSDSHVRHGDDCNCDHVEQALSPSNVWSLAESLLPDS